MVKVKRVYDPAEAGDGDRVLVDRLWPRGLTHEQAGLTEWAKDLAPSTELRTWFHANLSQWEEFRVRYLAELADKGAALRALAIRSRSAPVTLLYGSHDREHNHAILLAEQLGKIDIDEESGGG
jgi:uncharacterized protein YeaO (DUF488 family)